MGGFIALTSKQRQSMNFFKHSKQPELCGAVGGRGLGLCEGVRWDGLR